MGDTQKTLFFTVDAQDEGVRIDRWLAGRGEISSRSLGARLIEESRIKVNGHVVKASYRVKTGELVEVEIPAATTTDLQPYPIKIDIVYEDEHVIVVNKPAGLVVHPAAGHWNDTLVNALIAHTPHLSMGFHEHRPGIVHRIDRDTSGLLVVAKNNLAHEELARQFKNKTTHRIYWAVTFGAPKVSEGTIESFLKRHPTDRKRYASSKTPGDGKRAVTHFRVSTKNKGLSLVILKLDTGRTHQIRVHLSDLGAPIAADWVYGNRRRLQSITDSNLKEIISSLNRFVLHAAELGFKHPTTQQSLLFRVPWPPELQSIADLCGWKNPDDYKFEKALSR